MENVDFRLDAKVALITGAGRGIGAAIAQALASVGCAVAVQDIDLDVAQSVAAAIQAAGGKAIALAGDVSDLALAPRAVEQVVSRLGGLHILVNNAAIQQWIPWTELTPEELQNKYRANVVAPLHLTQLALPLFKSGGYGRVINLGSIQQRRGHQSTIAYSMTKAALWNMTKSLALELAPLGITVNMIAPGWFNTYRNRDDFKTPQDVERAAATIPMRRIGHPSDCAGAAVMLCSPAGSYITGQCLFIDGGKSAQ